MNKKIISLALTIVMVVAFAVPAFAAGHKTPEIIVTSGNVDGYNVPGSTIKYELTLADDDATSIKVGSKTLKIADFTKNSDGTYTYKGSYTIGVTDTKLTFVVRDMTQSGDYEFKKTLTFKTDPTRPVINATAVTTGTAFRIGIISILATDNAGLAKIAVNGKTIAEGDVINGKKTYVVNHEVAATGSYIIVVTDVAGNIAISTVTFNSDGTATTENQTPTTGSTVWNGGLLSGLTSLYQTNPQLYYYFKLFQNSEDFNENWQLWYLLSQTDLFKQTEGSTTTATNNNWLLYQLIFNDKDNMTEAEKQLYYAMLSGKLDSVDNNTLYWLLLTDKDLDIDQNLLYYMLTGSTGSSTTTANGNYLAYMYFFGSALDFVNGSEITDYTKDGKLTLNAPAIKDNSNAKYSWYKIVGGKWTLIASGSDSIKVDPVTGDKYKVVISSEYYYTTVTSDIFTVTDDMLKDDADAPVTPPTVDDDDDDSSDFTAEDITINGVKNNFIRVKKGEKIILVPNVTGYWTYDTSMFTGTGTTLAVLTAQKSGTSILLFTGIDEHGHTATKSILVEVAE